jgi:hypothetical protein
MLDVRHDQAVQGMSTFMRRVTPRTVAFLALLVLLAAELVLMVNPAHADQGNDINYLVGGPAQSVDEMTAVNPDPAYHEALRTQPLECSLLPECRLFLLNLSYPRNADPSTPYFVTVTATLHGTATYEMGLFADPQGNSSEVSEDAGTGATVAGGSRVLTTHLLKYIDDPIQQYGITMFMESGATTNFTIKIVTSTVPPDKPFESLNPSLTPISIPPPFVPTVVTTTTLPPPPPPTTPPTTAAATPPPAQTAPDSSFSQVFSDTTQFNNALAPQAGQLFKKAAVLKPPGKPSSLQLWLALLALPLGLLLLFPVLIKRRQRGVI